jgi:molybdopterin-guanine dinucleotide biosynthesis protein B
MEQTINMVLIVAAAGRSGSGKTVTLEYLISQLSVEGYKIGTIKHIHHNDFTIDTEGKNTWRYAKAGAKVIAAISPNEVAIIKKNLNATDNLDHVIEVLKAEALDIIFIEGYRDLIVKRSDVLKILTASDVTFLQEMLKESVEPILAISGLIAINQKKISQKHPVVKIPEEGQILVNLIKQHLITAKREIEASKGE